MELTQSPDGNSIEINLQSRPPEDGDPEAFICFRCEDWGPTYESSRHLKCVGVPCHCSCPGADKRKQKALRNKALAKLTEDEREALGF